MTQPGESDTIEIKRGVYAQAARRRDLLEASIDLALPALRNVGHYLEGTSFDRELARTNLRDAIYHLTVGTD